MWYLAGEACGMRHPTALEEDQHGEENKLHNRSRPSNDRRTRSFDGRLELGQQRFSLWLLACQTPVTTCARHKQPRRNSAVRASGLDSTGRPSSVPGAWGA